MKLSKIVLMALITIIFLGLILYFLSISEDNSFKKLNGRIVFQSDRGNEKCEIYSLEKEGIKYMFEGASPDFSSDGRFLVYISINQRKNENDNIAIYDFKNNKKELLDTGKMYISRFSIPVFSPNQKKIAFKSSKNNFDNIFIYDLESFSITQVTQFTETEKRKGLTIDDIEWSPDGSYIYFKVFKTGLFKIKIETQEIDLILSYKEWPISGFDLSQDDNLLVFSGYGNAIEENYKQKKDNIYALSLESGEIKQITKDGKTKEATVLSPDGTKICYYAFRNKSPFVGSELYMYDLETKKEYKLTETKRSGLLGLFNGMSTDKYPTWGKKYEENI